MGRFELAGSGGLGVTRARTPALGRFELALSGGLGVTRARALALGRFELALSGGLDAPRPSPHTFRSTPPSQFDLDPHAIRLGIERSSPPGAVRESWLGGRYPRRT